MYPLAGSTEREFSQLGASSSSGVCCNYPLAGPTDTEFPQFGASSCLGICCNRHGQQAASADWMSKLNAENREQLVKARKLGLLELSPSDEVEGELIFLQQRLLSSAIRRKHFIGYHFALFLFFFPFSFLSFIIIYLS